MEYIPYLENGILIRKKIKTRIVEENGEKYPVEEKELYEWIYDEMSSFKWTLIERIINPLKRALEPKRFKVIPELEIKYDINLETKRSLMVTPDVSVFKNLEGDFIHKDLTLDITEEKIIPVCIFESVSSSNPDKDYVKNRKLYAELGVKEYIILDFVTGKPGITLYRLEGGVYQKVMAEDGFYELRTLGLRMREEGAPIYVRFYEGEEKILSDDEMLLEMEKELKRKDEEIKKRDSLMEEKGKELKERGNQLREKDKQLREKDKQLREKDKQLIELLNEKDRQIKELLNKVMGY